MVFGAEPFKSRPLANAVVISVDRIIVNARNRSIVFFADFIKLPFQILNLFASMVSETGDKKLRDDLSHNFECRM